VSEPPISRALAILEGSAPDRPVLIAGATASGKSALAAQIAARLGGVVVNADALQVWSCWRVLSARPTPADEAALPHALYGHKAPGESYSVGHWLRDLAPLLAGPRRPVIVGGTGLYFTALTRGLAEIPPTPDHVRTEADALLRAGGLAALLEGIDAATAARIDRRNPARVQRAWEVQRTTGRGLAAWQDATPPPLLPLAQTTPLLLEVAPETLAGRIDARFEKMMATGAPEEVAAVAGIWDESALWAQAIGARELITLARGQIDRPEAIARAQAASRQYAKRQRTWFRARMRDWHKIVGV